MFLQKLNRLIYQMQRMRWKLALTAVAIVLFQTSISKLDASDASKVDQGVIEEIRTKALPAWKLYSDRLLRMKADFEWKYQVETYSKQFGSAKPFDEFEATYHGSLTPGRFLTKSTNIVELNNPEYMATLRIGEQPGTYVLKGGKFKRPDTELRVDYRESECRALLTALYPIDSLHGIPSALKDESRIVEATRDGTKLYLRWSVDPPKTKRDLLGFDLSLVVDSALDYRFVSGSLISRFERFQATTEYTVESSEHDQLGVIPRLTKELETNTLDPYYKHTRTFTLIKFESPSQTPNRAFYLPHYDVPESALDAFDVRPAPKYNRFLLAVICIVVAGMAFWAGHRLARRQRE